VSYKLAAYSEMGAPFLFWCWLVAVVEGLAMMVAVVGIVLLSGWNCEKLLKTTVFTLLLDFVGFRAMP